MNITRDFDWLLWRNYYFSTFPLSFSHRTTRRRKTFNCLKMVTICIREWNYFREREREKQVREREPFRWWIEIKGWKKFLGKIITEKGRRNKRWKKVLFGEEEDDPSCFFSLSLPLLLSLRFFLSLVLLSKRLSSQTQNNPILWLVIREKRKQSVS